MSFFDKLISFLGDVIDAVNPANTDFGDASSIFLYVVKMIIIVGVTLGTVSITMKLPKFFGFLKDTRNELKKVEWLSRALTYRYSALVIVSMISFILFILAVDKSLLLVRNLII